MYSSLPTTGSLSPVYFNIRRFHKNVSIQRGEQKGIQIGEQRGTENTLLVTIINLKESLKLTTQQAMDAMKIPKNEQKKFEKLVESSE